MQRAEQMFKRRHEQKGQFEKTLINVRGRLEKIRISLIIVSFIHIKTGKYVQECETLRHYEGEKAVEKCLRLIADNFELIWGDVNAGECAWCV